MSEGILIEINVPQLDESFSLKTLSSRTIKQCFTEVLHRKYSLRAAPILHKFKEMFGISSDKKLDVEKTLDDYKIQNEAEIYIFIKSEVVTEYIFVEEDPGDKFFAFRCEYSHTIGDIKKMVEDKTGFKSENVVLKVNGEALEEDGMKLSSLQSDYYPSSPVQFCLKQQPIKIECCLEWLRNGTEINVQRTDKVIDVIRSACGYFPETGDLASNDEFVATLDDVKLELEATLADYDVTDGSRISVWSRRRGPSKIFAQQFRGDKLLVVEVPVEVPVGVVQEIIASKLGTRPENIALEFNGAFLSSESLSQAGVVEGSTVIFHQRLAMETMIGQPEPDFGQLGFDKQL